VNPRLGTLFRLCAAGVALLVTITAYWQIWAAPGLAQRRDNARLVVRQLQIERGLILASNGRTVLAANRKVRRNGQDLYLRRYPLGGLFAAPVGYNTPGQGRTGLELAENDYLTASNRDLSTLFEGLGERITGQTVTGNNIVTSLSVPAQTAAMRALAGARGAVIALEPDTGRIVAMASSPSFDPGRVAEDFPALSQAPGSPLVNRTTQGLYAPGSTFKVLTAAAAIDSGLLRPDSVIDARGSCITVQTLPLCNFGGESFGSVTFTDSLTHSINTVFAQVGQRLGQDVILDYMRRFGFFEEPPLDYPTDQMVPSGLYGDGRALPPSTGFDLARVAIGQERLLATPFEMAWLTATVANAGVRMRPTLVDRIIEPDGGTLQETRPDELDRPISAETAAALGTMMRDVVNEGTGTAAALAGIEVAGKTGTAETGVEGVNTAWFIAFAPADDPRIAVATVLEQTAGTGGVVAAPVARDVIEAYLNSGVANSAQ
jgi:peptidoglycan glycosyltransferase